MAQVRVRKRGKTFSYIFESRKFDSKRKVIEKGYYSTKAEAYKDRVAAYNDFLHGNIGITSEAITLIAFMTQWLNEVSLSHGNANQRSFRIICGGKFGILTSTAIISRR